ncbi:hypothetical protein [Nitrolancea hollandica]|uniref:Uncharacterized protein n=1 Tax=Nitrolancea hollandica Lb TaxID=1129897 RepID=I4EF94_9BACT|nr:hypothetical protein [Nitrolancea hollandica]CCF83356.1 hypothetical protein NITHO_2230012 [Nitrolancea hollandica Lb]
MDIRLSKNQTNALKDELEERKYGKHLTSMELADKANVALDEVNRFERHLPIEDPATRGRIATALGITPELLAKIGGSEEISMDALSELEQCILDSTSTGTTSEKCQRLGLRPVLH